jgi:hypothetical protein
MQVVRDNDDPTFGAAQALDQIDDVASLHDAESRGWFVEHNDPRIPQQRATHCENLALSP